MRAPNNFASWVRKATAPWNIRGIPKLLYSSRHFLLGKEPKLFELENGTRLYLHPEDYVHCMMFYNRYSREILDVFKNFLRPGDTAIDVGAHIGYFTLFLAGLVTSSGHVYGFEPDSRAMSFLERSVASSGMEWIHVSSLALAADRRSIKFYLAKGLGSSSAIKSLQQLEAKETAISTVSLDELVDEGKVVGIIRLVKIDIEGFEVEAIRGMVNVLMRHRPVILVEVNEEMLKGRGENPSTLFELLRSLNYRIEELLKPPRGRYKASVATKAIEPQSRHQGYYDALCLPMELNGKAFSELTDRPSS